MKKVLFLLLPIALEILLIPAFVLIGCGGGAGGRELTFTRKR
jgi:hypothetical protein